MILSLLAYNLIASTSLDKDLAVLLTKAKNQNNIEKVLSIIPMDSKLWWSIPVVPPIRPDEFRTLILTSNFGWRAHPISNNWRKHQGIDISLDKGTDICAPADGIVILAEYDKLLGYYVKIQHSFGFATIMGHLDRVTVIVNQNVKVGEKIGECGNTGQSTGVHLHYSILKNESHVDPLKYLYMLLQKSQ